MSRLPAHFKAPVLIGGAPGLQFRGIPAMLRVSGRAWRLDVRPLPLLHLTGLCQIPFPKQAGAEPKHVTVLNTAEGNCYRWIREAGDAHRCVHD